MEYSASELKEMTTHQQEQIEQNQQLLLSREQRLKYLNQQQTTEENLRFKHIKHHLEQQEIKNFRLKTLQNQIKLQKTSNSTFGLFEEKIFSFDINRCLFFFFRK